MEVTYICKVNSTHVNCAYKIMVMCFREVVLHIGQSETGIACGFHVFDRSILKRIFQNTIPSKFGSNWHSSFSQEGFFWYIDRSDKNCL